MISTDRFDLDRADVRREQNDSPVRSSVCSLPKMPVSIDKPDNMDETWTDRRSDNLTSAFLVRSNGLALAGIVLQGYRDVPNSVSANRTAPSANTFSTRRIKIQVLVQSIMVYNSSLSGLPLSLPRSTPFFNRYFSQRAQKSFSMALSI